MIGEVGEIWGLALPVKRLLCEFSYVRLGILGTQNNFFPVDFGVFNFLFVFVTNHYLPQGRGTIK